MLVVIVNDDCHTLRQWQVQSRKLGRPFHRRLARRSHHRHSCGNPGHGDGEDGQGEIDHHLRKCGFDGGMIRSHPELSQQVHVELGLGDELADRLGNNDFCDDSGKGDLEGIDNGEGDLEDIDSGEGDLEGLTFILSSLSSQPPILAGIPHTFRAITRTETTDWKIQNNHYGHYHPNIVS